MRESYVVHCGKYSGRYYTFTGAVGHAEHILRYTEKRFADIDIEAEGRVVRKFEVQADRRGKTVIRAIE